MEKKREKCDEHMEKISGWRGEKKKGKKKLGRKSGGKKLFPGVKKGEFFQDFCLSECQVASTTL